LLQRRERKADGDVRKTESEEKEEEGVVLTWQRYKRESKCNRFKASSMETSLATRAGLARTLRPGTSVGVGPASLLQFWSPWSNRSMV
jgi:hypothetical protein